MSAPYIDIHTHQQASTRPGILALRSIELGDATKDLESGTGPAAVGLHPWRVSRGTLPQDLERLQALLAHPRVLAVGETGLDKVADVPYQAQTEAFLAQIDLAEKVGRPMVIHCVRATADLLALRKRLSPKQPWIIHGFNGSEEESRQLIQTGVLLSFGAGLLNPDTRVAKYFRWLRHEYIFLETDTGSTEIEVVYERAAQLRGCSLEELKTQLHENWSKLFPAFLETP